MLGLGKFKKSGFTLDGDLEGSGGSTYELPTASASTLGGVKVGSGLTIDSVGVLSVTASEMEQLATLTTDGTKKYNEVMYQLANLTGTFDNNNKYLLKINSNYYFQMSDATETNLYFSNIIGYYDNGAKVKNCFYTINKNGVANNICYENSDVTNSTMTAGNVLTLYKL